MTIRDARPTKLFGREYDYSDDPALETRRAWLRGAIVDGMTDVVASYTSTFYPTHGRTTEDELVPLASNSVTERREAKAAWEKETERRRHDWSRPPPRDAWRSISGDAAGWYLVTARGEVVRDPERVRAILEPDRNTNLKNLPGFSEFVLRHLRSAHQPSRKRLARHNLGRAMLYRDLVPVMGYGGSALPRFGHRGAARCILAWEDEIIGPEASPGTTWPTIGGTRREETMMATCRRIVPYLHEELYE